MEWYHVKSRHSRRRVLLSLSIRPFWDGLPGWIKRSSIPFCWAQAFSFLLMNWPVITTNVGRFSSISYHLIKNVNQLFCRDALVSLGPKCSTRTFVHNIDNAYLLTSRSSNPIADKIHCPAFVNLARAHQRLIGAANALTLRWNAEIKFFPAPDPINSFMIILNDVMITITQIIENLLKSPRYICCSGRT